MTTPNPPSTCPACNETFPPLTCGCKPPPGSFVVCSDCGAVLIVGEAEAHRLMTDEERGALGPTMAALVQRVQRAVTEMHVERAKRAAVAQ